jgi:hypothetical protein
VSPTRRDLTPQLANRLGDLHIHRHLKVVSILVPRDGKQARPREETDLDGVVVALGRVDLGHLEHLLVDRVESVDSAFESDVLLRELYKARQGKIRCGL